MENYLLYGEIGAAVGKTVYKGRRRGTIEFHGLHKWNKRWKQLVTNEVRLMLALRHRNVLQFSEWYETSKHIWVVTELASGGTLAELLEQDGGISLGNAPAFLSDIAAGLRYLHTEGVVYCDLQPSKITLDSCQTLKLSDFTLAHRAGEPPPVPPSHLIATLRTSFLTSTQDRQNTHDTHSHPSPSTHHTPPPHPHQTPSLLDRIEDSAPPSLHPSLLSTPSPFYMAPESLRGEGFSLTSDLWSLGCVAYELCTGIRLFHGLSLEDLIQNMTHPELHLDMLESQTGLTEGGHNSGPSLITTILPALLQPSPEDRWSWQQLSPLLLSDAYIV